MQEAAKWQDGSMPLWHCYLSSIEPSWSPAVGGIAARYFPHTPLIRVPPIALPPRTAIGLSFFGKGYQFGL